MSDLEYINCYGRDSRYGRLKCKYVYARYGFGETTISGWKVFTTSHWLGVL